MPRNFVTVFLAALAACSGSNAGPHPNAGPDQACTDIASARCAKLDACNKTGIVTRYGDMATCNAREKLACTLSLQAPATTVTASLQEQCIPALTAQSCNDYLLGIFPVACLPPAGPRATLAGCAYGGQCVTTDCAIAKGEACGTCSNVPAPGDSCARIGCGRSGFVCVRDTMTCGAPAADGGSCGLDVPCAPSLACVGATNTAQGSCQPRLSSAGAVCDSHRRTAPDCDHNAGLHCNPISKICDAIAFASPGQPCGITSGGVYALCTNGSCPIPDGGSTGICFANAADDGGGCDLDAGAACVSPARCVVNAGAGACQMPLLSCQ